MLSEGLYGKIGGSDIGAILGVSRWKKPIDIFARIVHGETTADNPLMRRGRRFEPVVLAEYQDETGAELLGPCNLEFPGKPHLRASLDNVARREGERRVVEVKTASFRMLSEWGQGSDEVPMDYLAQTQWYMAAADLGRADLVVLLGGCELRIYTLDADSDLQAMLLTEAEKFWKDYVLTKTPPPVDGSEAYREYLAQRHPRNGGQMLEATPEVDAIAHELGEYERLAEHAEVEAEKRRNQLRAFIGDAGGIVGAGWKATWKRNKDSQKTDWERVAKDVAPASDLLDHLVAKHTTIRPGARVFRCAVGREKR